MTTLLHPQRYVPARAIAYAPARAIVPAAKPRVRWLAVVIGALLTVWQLWAGRLRLPTRYSTSYWVVTWDHGFVRRGLSGEINQALFGSDLTGGAVTLSLASGLLAGLAILIVGWALILKRDSRVAWFGVLLIASPAAVKSAVAFSRPDLISLFALLLVGLATSMRAGTAGRRLVLLAAGGWLAGVTLIQEAVIIQIVPWSVLLVLTSVPWRRWRQWVLDLVVLGLLPVASMALVVLKGVASSEQVTSLRADASHYLGKTGSGTVANYLADSVAYSVRTVIAVGPYSTGIMLGTGLVLFFGIPAIVARLAGVRLLGVFASGRAKLVAATVILPAFGVQLATGFDWLRWTSTWGTLWCLTAGLMLLRGDRAGLIPSTVGAKLPKARTALLVIAMLAVAMIPSGPAVAVGSCGYTYLQQEWNYPISKATTMLDGRTPQAEDFPRESCGSLKLPPRNAQTEG